MKLISLRDRTKTVPAITQEFNLLRKSKLKKKAIEFAKKIREKIWSNVLFTDESKFELFGKKRRMTMYGDLHYPDHQTRTWFGYGMGK